MRSTRSSNHGPSVGRFNIYSNHTIQNECGRPKYPIMDVVDLGTSRDGTTSNADPARQHAVSREKPSCYMTGTDITELQLDLLREEDSSCEESRRVAHHRIHFYEHTSAYSKIWTTRVLQGMWKARRVALSLPRYSWSSPQEHIRRRKASFPFLGNAILTHGRMICRLNGSHELPPL